jgi:hypothetical protein
MRYLTFLREPLKRYASHFNYQCHEMGVDWTPESFLAERRFDNFMTKRIAGAFDVELAKKRLAEDFAFVGLAERFDESLLLMRRTLGLDGFDVRYERRNASRDPAYHRRSQDLLRDDGFVEEARKRNALDLELYDYAVNEIYPRFVDRYGPALADDVDDLRFQNAEFRFGWLRRACWTAYRGLVYSRLERSVRAHLKPGYAATELSSS